MAFLKRRKLVLMTFSSAYMLALYKNYEPWMMAQWLSLPEETQNEWKKSMDKDHEKEEDDMMFTLFGF